MNAQIKICCGSYYGTRQAEVGGVKRIELNSALHTGGLTPSMAILRLIKRHTELSVMTMIRLHGTGFHYLSQSYNVMAEETRDMIRNGADGTVLNCLDVYGNINTEQSGHITTLAKVDHRQVVFHHTFDCMKDPFEVVEALTNMRVDHVLTSGTYPVASEGEEVIRQLQKRYGDQIGILTRCGIDVMNAKELTAYTGVKQIRSSCKDWPQDETTCGECITCSYGPQDRKSDCGVINSKKVEHLIQNVRQPSAE